LKEGKLMNGKVERYDRIMGEKFYSRNFYSRIKDMEESLRTYGEYYNKFKQHMGLHGLTPYEKLKELQVVRTPKSFGV